MNIGEGSFSTVFKVRRISDNLIYALKKVSYHTLTEKLPKHKVCPKP